MAPTLPDPAAGEGPGGAFLGDLVDRLGGVDGVRRAHRAAAGGGVVGGVEGRVDGEVRGLAQRLRGEPGDEGAPRGAGGGVSYGVPRSRGPPT